MANYDLSGTLAKHLDRHLVFPLLEFLQYKGMYSEKEILQAKLDMLKRTNMVDYAADVYCALEGTDTVPEELKAKRAEVLGKLRSLFDGAKPMLDFLSEPSLVAKLKQDKLFNLQFLKEEFGVGTEQIDALFHLAKFQFECGNYKDSADHLHNFRSLAVARDKTFSALWGKLAAEIMMQKWDQAWDDLSRLREAIDNKNFSSPLNQLTQRCWLMHWALFVYFNHPSGRTAIIDLFFQDLYMNSIQTLGQHLLRYLACAVIINRDRRNTLKELVRVIQQEQYSYSDPLTDFVLALFVNFDFDRAQSLLRECEKVIDQDYFLAALKDEFVESARLFIFESYCRLHSAIDIKMLADRLNMDLPSAERWIVNLISNARLNAKIDSQLGTVIMGTQQPTPFDGLMDKAQQLAARTVLLANAIHGFKF